MTKQKRSFFEKLTGVRRIDADETTQIHPRHDRQDYPQEPFMTQYEAQEETYEFPSGYDETRYTEQVNEVPVQQPVAQPMMQTDPGTDSEGQLTIDVYQTDDDIVIKSTIAGVKPEDLDVNINNDMVTIRGERKLEEQVDPENYYYQECYWGPFSRSVILPVEIIAEKAEATMKNGILTIRLPKADTTKTRRIQVRGF